MKKFLVISSGIIAYVIVVIYLMKDGSDIWNASQFGGIVMMLVIGIGYAKFLMWEKCPHCQAKIKAKSLKCPHCEKELKKWYDD